MRPKHALLIVFGVALLCGLMLFATAGRGQDLVIAAVHRLDPDAVVERTALQPIAGFTMVNVRGQTLLVSTDSRYVIQGEVFDLAKHRDLSEEVRAQSRLAAISTIPDTNRIFFRSPHERHRVIVFFDPECPFCRQMMGNVQAYEAQGITLEVLAFPRNGLDSDSFKRADSIWCSPDRAAALIASLTGPVEAKKSCADIVKQQFELAEHLAVPGTPALLDDHGHYLGGFMTPEQLSLRLNGPQVAFP